MHPARLLLAVLSLGLAVSCSVSQPRSQPLRGVTEYYRPGDTPPPPLVEIQKTRRPSWLSRITNPDPEEPYSDKATRSRHSSPTSGSTSAPSFANPDGTISRIEGNAMIRSDGTKSWLIGNTVFHNNGTTSRIVGDTLINPDGTKSPRIKAE